MEYIKISIDHNNGGIDLYSEKILPNTEENNRTAFSISYRFIP